MIKRMIGKIFLIRTPVTPIELLLRRARRQGFGRRGRNPFIVWSANQRLAPWRETEFKTS
jgi:hypothetical protein